MRTLIVGHGGRESALATRMAEHSELHAFVGHENPSIVRMRPSLRRRARARRRVRPAGRSRLRPRARDRPRDGQCRRAAAGGRRRRAARAGHARGRSHPRGRGDRVEQDVRRELLAEVAPEASPLLRVARDRREVEEAIASFGSIPVAVKPPGLTGGKGVKVMGPHLASHDEARDYAIELLDAGKAGERRAHRGEDRRRRVHHPGDQRRPDRRVPALHLRLSPTATTATRAGHGRAWARCRCHAHAPIHDRRALQTACSIVERVIAAPRPSRDAISQA